jgi:hypothetical protein
MPSAVGGPGPTLPPELEPVSKKSRPQFAEGSATTPMARPCALVQAVLVEAEVETYITVVGRRRLVGGRGRALGEAGHVVAPALEQRPAGGVLGAHERPVRRHHDQARAAGLGLRRAQGEDELAGPDALVGLVVVLGLDPRERPGRARDAHIVDGAHEVVDGVPVSLLPDEGVCPSPAQTIDAATVVKPLWTPSMVSRCSLAASS